MFTDSEDVRTDRVGLGDGGDDPGRSLTDDVMTEAASTEDTSTSDDAGSSAEVVADGGGATRGAVVDGSNGDTQGEDTTTPHNDRRARRRRPPQGHTHQTIPSSWVERREEVKSLVDLSINCLAANSRAIEDIRGLDEPLAVRLLREIMMRGKLTYKLAMVFVDSGHDELSEAVASLNLWEAISLESPSYARGASRCCHD